MQRTNNLKSCKSTYKTLLKGLYTEYLNLFDKFLKVIFHITIKKQIH